MAGIAYVQDTPGIQASGSSLNVTMGANVTANDLLVCCVASTTTGSGAVVSSISAGGDADVAWFQAAQSNFTADSRAVAIWYGIALGTSSAPPTFTITCISGTTVIYADISEFSGVLASNPFDNANAQHGTAANIQGGATTPAEANELFVMVGVGLNAITSGPTQSFNSISPSWSAGVGFAYLVYSGTSSRNPAFVMGSSAGYVAGLACFTPAVVTPSLTPAPRSNRAVMRASGWMREASGILRPERRLIFPRLAL